MYTDCITIAGSPGIDQERFRFLPLLSGVRPPGSQFPPFVFLWIPAIFVALGFIFLVAFVVFVVITALGGEVGTPSASSSETSGNTGALISWLTTILITAALVSYTSFPLYREHVFNRLLNLQITDWTRRVQERRNRILVASSVLQRLGCHRAYRAMIMAEQLRMLGPHSSPAESPVVL